MKSVLSEISRLRNGDDLIIERKNTNRYRVVATETDGSKTAYYFTAPIYNIKTLKAVDLNFHSENGIAYATGSNVGITVSENIKMENAEGLCFISLADKISHITEHEVVCGNERIYPTTNGVAMKLPCSEEKSYSFSIQTNKPFLEVRANDKYFALMSEQFRPFVSISCIGTLDVNGNIISPSKLTYQKINDRKYVISVTPCSPLGRSVLVEADLYESKLFQDTTVESKNPKLNNAFGGVGFIGTTNEFGEQWLYSRPDFTKMTELNDKKILNAVLHIPKLNNFSAELTVSKVSARFCSFGSTWDNKISESSMLTDPQINGGYIDLDMMPVLTDKQGRLTSSEGIILKAKRKNSGFSVISTGDNYLFPQILEINYR